MNIYLDVQSPAVKEAGKLASAYGLANHGLVSLRRAYWNLPTPALYEESIFRSEGALSHLGPLVVDTGKHTARAAADKIVVRETSEEVLERIIAFRRRVLEGLVPPGTAPDASTVLLPHGHREHEEQD